MSRVENWTSSEGRTEVHYFRSKDDEYLFGYNPQLTPEILQEALKAWAEHLED